MQKKSIYGNEEKDRLKDYLSAEELRQTAFLLTEMRFIVLNASLWHCREPWRVPERRVTDNLVMIVVDGEYDVTVDGKNAILRRGDAVFIPENVPHNYSFASGFEEGHNFILHVLPLYPSVASPFHGFTSPFLSLSGFESKLESLYRAVALRNYDEATAFSYVGGILQQILIDAALRGNYRCGGFSFSDSRVKEAYRFIAENFTVDLSIRDIAATTGLKEVQFRRIFQRETGFGPSAYIHRLRLLHSVRLLLRYPYKLERIASESGFNSVTYFCSSFLSFFKMSPEKFRRQYR